MQTFKQIQRRFDRRRARIDQLGPLSLVVSFYRRFVLSEGKLEADVTVHMTVGHVVNNLAYGPSFLSVWRVQLCRAQSGDCTAHPLRRCGNLLDEAVSLFRSGGTPPAEFSDG